MRMVALLIKAVQRLVGGEQCALPDFPALKYRAVHALVKAGLVQEELHETVKRALLKDLGGAGVLHDEHATQQVLDEGAHGQKP